MTSGPLDSIRTRGGDWLRSTLAGDEELRQDELASQDDTGLFGPASVVWRVHGDSAMLIGGLRSLLIQTLHPLAMAGVAIHSDYKNDPFGRLNRTGRFVGATTYGSTEAAEAAIKMVRRVHGRVKGIAPDGRPYSANDPHLLLWVHITEVDSFLRAFNSFGNGKLTDAEKDQYVAEMGEIAVRLGSEPPPRSVAELDACMQAFRSECKVGPQARETVRFLLAPPVPLAVRGSYAIITAAAISLLPRWARRELRLPMPAVVGALGVRPVALALTRVVGWLMSAQSSSRDAEISERMLT